MYELRPQFYDEFQCIADRCSYTCCSQWTVLLDDNTYETYRKYPGLSMHCEEKDGNKQIALCSNGDCPFLNEQKLCKIVSKYGEGMLSEVCTNFPRLSYLFGGILERSLSNACPVVVSLLNQIREPIGYILEDSMVCTPGECTEVEDLKRQCRDSIIDVLQTREFPLWFRLYVLGQIGLKINDSENENWIDQIQPYFSPDYLVELWNVLSEINDGTEALLERLCRMFMAITVRKNQGAIYEKNIANIRNKIEDSEYEMKKIARQWKEFEVVWKEKEYLLENISVNYIFNTALLCGSTESVQQKLFCLLIEIAMVRFTWFLLWVEKGELDEGEMIDTVCYYSRRIEHNTESVNKFLEDNEFGIGKLFLLLKD